MNKELYIKKENKIKELENLRVILKYLKNFLEENETKFKNKESIKALNKIKLYLDLKGNDYEECKIKVKQLVEELYDNCNHEIAIKYSNIPEYTCLVCNSYRDKKGNPIEKVASISIDTTKDYFVGYIIKDIFKDIVNSDKDLMETISEAVEELQYDRNIKVYRR